MTKPKPYRIIRIGARVASVFGASGRVVDFTSIGGTEYYIIQIGTSRGEQITRHASEVIAA